jgi:hypothetical protein
MRSESLFYFQINPLQTNNSNVVDLNQTAFESINILGVINERERKRATVAIELTQTKQRIPKFENVDGLDPIVDNVGFASAGPVLRRVLGC